MLALVGTAGAGERVVHAAQEIGKGLALEDEFEKKTRTANLDSELALGVGRMAGWHDSGEV